MDGDTGTRKVLTLWTMIQGHKQY